MPARICLGPRLWPAPVAGAWAVAGCCALMLALALGPGAAWAQNVSVGRDDPQPAPAPSMARPDGDADGNDREERAERAREAAERRAAEAAGREVAPQLVTVTGRAVIGPAGRDAARRAAMEDALYLAALEGGADLDAYSLTENGILVGESVLLRPASRILDFEILSEREADQRFEVELRAWVGTSPLVGVEPHRRAVSVLAITPDLAVSPDAPAWMPEVLEQVFPRLVDAARAVPSVQVGTRAVTLEELASAGQDKSFDYAAIMAGATSVAGLPDGTQALHLALEASAGRMRGAVLLRGALSLRDGPGLAPVARQPIEAEITFMPGSPIRALNVLNATSREGVADEIVAQIAAGLASVLEAYATRPLTARLVRAGEDLQVPLGRRDGLSTRSLGFVEGGETPWGVLRIVELGEGQARLRPVNALRASDALIGREVRFIPGDP